MGATTKIEWCHATWSPWRGCTKVSEGCRHCYAERQSKRNPKILGEWGPDGHRTINSDWTKPLAWDRAAARAGERRRVFPSVCDLFEEFDRDVRDVQGEVVRVTLGDLRAEFVRLVVNRTPNLDWLVLTKRPENVEAMLERISVASLPGNLWLGVSVEDQASANARIPLLLDIPAAVRWVSYEPALGPVDFDGWLDRGYESGGPAGWVAEPSIDWIVLGGESGPHARACNVEWIRDTVAQCGLAGVPVFVKQLGASPYRNDGPPDDLVRHIALRDPKGGDPAEWPEDLRVREFPAARKVA